MKVHFEPTVLGLLYGIVGIIAFLVVGSLTGSGLFGIASFCLVSAFCAVFHCRRFPESAWYTPLAISIPLWLLLAGPADPGQFRQYLPGLVVGLALSYGASFWGARMAKPSIAEAPEKGGQ